jgi:hypothetical protein
MIHAIRSSFILYARKLTLSSITREEPTMRSSDLRNIRPATDEDEDCAAFNVVFDELGFDWRLEPRLYSALSSIADERERLCAYVREHQPHLLKAYDLQFLCDAILDMKRRHCAALPATPDPLRQR